MSGDQSIVLAFVHGHTKIGLLRRKLSEDRVIYEFRHDGEHVGELTTLAVFVPTIFLLPRGLAAWAGSRLVIVDLEERRQAEYESKEDIVGLLPLDAHWAIITELGVELRTEDLLQKAARYDHSDVLLDGWMVEDRIRLKDFNGEEIELDRATLERIKSPIED